MKHLKAWFFWSRSKAFMTGTALLMLGAFVACATTQDIGCGWIKEKEVAGYAVAFAESSQDGSITAGHIRSMNTWLQELFEIGSCDGARPERGVRAMDVFKAAYFKANGDEKVWQRALALRRSGPEEPKDVHFPSVIPPDYK